ncbi:MAG: hypothetical protein WAQ27_03980 [Candidatus Microsaccharimonas sp.]
MHKRNQNGNALVVVVIILAIAIIGVLGFVLWQKLTTKEDPAQVQNTSSNTSQDEATKKYKTAQIDSTFPVGLSWTYPEDWTITSEGNGPTEPSETTTQKFTLTSPNNKYEVIYHVGINGGLGGSCEPGSDTLQTVKRTAVPKFTKSVFTETIGQVSDGYRYISALYQNNNEIQNVKPGDSFCEIYLRNVIPLTEDGNMVILAAEINVKQFDSSDQYGPTEIYPTDISTIEKAIDDPEYDDAVKILLSTVSE